MDTNNKLSVQDKKFCLVYVSGPAPYNGNALKTYDLVFNGVVGKCAEDSDSDSEKVRRVDTSLKVREFMLRPEVAAYIEKLQSETVVNAATLRPRLTETLLQIADECSSLVCEDRFGTKLSPAPLRSVAVNAISKLTDMYGIKEDIAHKVMLEGAEGDGITFNVIMPERNRDNELSELS